jgi:hypothetical protein
MAIGIFAKELGGPAVIVTKPSSANSKDTCMCLVCQ